MSKSVFKSEQGRERVLAAYREILQGWPVANRHQYVETRIGKTFVIESGDSGNPPLLLLHGSVSNSFTWMGDVARFAENFRVFAIDLVGEPGLSAEARPAYESGEYATWLEDVINALQLETVSIVGMSLGGWMALEFATHYPQRVNRLALICPGGLGRQRLSLIPKALFYSLFGQWGRDRITRLLNGGSMPSSTKIGKAMEFTMTIRQHFNPRTARLPIFSADQLSRLSMPVWVCFGDTDAVLDGPGSLQHAQAHIANCQAIVLAGRGHLILDQGQAVCEFLSADPD